MQKRFVFSYQYVHKLKNKKLGTSFTEEKKDTVYIRHIKLQQI